MRVLLEVYWTFSRREMELMINENTNPSELKKTEQREIYLMEWHDSFREKELSKEKFIIGDYALVPQCTYQEWIGTTGSHKTPTNFVVMIPLGNVYSEHTYISICDECLYSAWGFMRVELCKASLRTSREI